MLRSLKESLKRKFNENHFYKNGPKSFHSYYDKLSQSNAYIKLYRDIYELDIPLQNNLSKKQFKLFLDLINKEKHKTILDLGCGNASLVEHFSKTKDIKGVDFCHHSSNKNIIQASYQDMILENNSYDFIYCLDSFYLVRKEKEVLNKLVRALNEKGSLLIFKSFQKDLKSSTLYTYLEEQGASLKLYDFSEDDREYWIKLEYILKSLEEDFYNEGSGSLYRAKKSEIDKNLILHQNNQLNRYALLFTKKK